MLSSTFTRRFNPVKLFARSFSFQRTSETLIPQPNPQNFDSSTVCETLSCYGNDWKSALEFFNWAESECNFHHTSDTYNRMIDILGKFFEFYISWDLILRMSKSPSSIPNYTTFRIMFRRYASARLIREAVSTYDRLHEFDLKDDTSYCNLIDALCEHKHVTEAQELCFGDKMEPKNEMTARNRTKICNMILRGWFKMGWWSNCREFWEKMDEHRVNKSMHSYSIYMDILCKSGKPWKTVKLYKELKRKGVKLDVVAYNTVVHAIGKAEGVDSAVGVYREMADSGCTPTVVTYNTIIKLYCQDHRVVEAKKVLDEMCKKDVVPDVMTYQCFFVCLEKKQELLALFDTMIESGVRPRMDTYVMLMRKLSRWGFIEPVLSVWEKMGEHGCSPNESAYKVLIDTLIQNGMLDLARKYDEEMLAKGLSPKPRKELRTDVVKEV